MAPSSKDAEKKRITITGRYGGSTVRPRHAPSTAATSTNITLTGVKHLPLPSTDYRLALHNLNTVMYTVSPEQMFVRGTILEAEVGSRIGQQGMAGG